MAASLRIRLAALPLGKSRLAGSLEFSILDAAGESEACRAWVACDLDHLGSRIHVRGSVEGEAESHCHRCLEPYRRPITAMFELTLQRSAPESESDGDVEFVPDNVVEYDLGPRVQEAVLLEEPLQLVCAPDCGGLCPQCGANLNREACGCAVPVDPRWAPLATLRDRIDKPA